jgi:hypothetical protein
MKEEVKGGKGSQKREPGESKFDSREDRIGYIYTLHP